MTIAHPAHDPCPEVLNARAERALELYRTRGHEIERIADEHYLVPSCSSRRFYRVRYGGLEESCSCPDYEHHGAESSCKHLLAVGILHAKRRRPTFDQLYTKYLQTIRDEEARLGRQFTPSEAERLNTAVMAPLNRAVWAERSCEDV